MDKEVVCKESLHTTRHGAIEGKTQEAKTKFYNLNVIISVGYRVKSQRGTQFRQWATQRLKDYLTKSYVNSFVLLNHFDTNNLEAEKLNENITYEIQYGEAKIAINEMTTPWLPFLS